MKVPKPEKKKQPNVYNYDQFPLKIPKKNEREKCKGKEKEKEKDKDCSIQ